MGSCVCKISLKGSGADIEETTKPLASDLPETRSTRDGRAKPAAKPAKREVVCADALTWIRELGTFPSNWMVLTSLPDMSEVVEFAPRFEDWEAFFMDAVQSILEALPQGGVAVFYQTDVRLPGIGQVSKSYLVLHAAARAALACKYQIISPFLFQGFTSSWLQQHYTQLP